MYKVKEEDLIGELKSFPIEVVQKMLERQVEQGNKEDVSVFQEHSYVSNSYGGFDWEKTCEGTEFWNNVISNSQFGIFFNRFPKQSEINTNVYFRGDRSRGHEIISTLEKLGGDNSFFQLEGIDEDSLYYISKENNYIKACDKSDEELISLIKCFYTEQKLPVETIEIDGKVYEKSEVISRLKDLKTYKYDQSKQKS